MSGEAVALIITAIAAVITAVGKIMSDRKKGTNEILAELKTIKENQADINAKQNRALKCNTLARLRKLHNDAMRETKLVPNIWTDFYECYAAYVDLGGNGEAKTLKIDMAEKRTILIRKAG